MQNLSNLNLSKGTIPPLLKYKIVFLGDQAVGKSSIINRFIYDIFDGNDHRPTIGIDFISQNIFLEEKTIRLQLWDTAGQERFRSLIPNYIRDATVAVIVYDITNQNSFRSVSKWVDDVKNQRGQGVIVAVLGNKVDLNDQREVKTEDLKNFAQQNQIMFKQVSAKSGINIQQFFKEIAAQLPEVNGPTYGNKIKNQQQVVEPAIILQTKKQEQQKPQKKKNCC